MAEFVEGDGWISDDSSFYGDEATQKRLENSVQTALKRPYQPSLPLVPNKKRKPNSDAVANSKSEAKPGEKSEHQRGETVLDFLKSRPQIAALQKMAASERKTVKKVPARTASGEEAADLLENDRFEGHPSAWQKNETVDAFLKRAPVADPESAKLGPWLWVSNPKISWSQKKHQAKTDVASFIEGGELLLEVFQVQKAKVERSKPGAAPATITRQMRPYKEQLEEDLLTLAVKTATTCGKWMFFPAPEDYPRYWRLVAEATAACKLGPTSKAATLDLSNSTGLICVYTYDFTDMNDVRRVLEQLTELGLCQTESTPIYYKCDAYTYLDIKSDNEYKLRASLYSSKEVLEGDAKAKQDGPIASFKKRNNTLDSFFAS